MGNIAKQFDIQIIYYIVGDGPFKNYIKQNIVKNKNIDVVFYGAIQHEKLDNFLDENVDVLTAMGTSVLEGAKLHIPTILIDGAYGPIKGDYVYRMLSTTRDYDLGHIITKSDMAPGNKSLQEIVVKIIQNYDSVAEESYQYYIKNHTIESVVDKFLSFVTQTKLTYNMIDKAYFKKSWAIWLHDALHPLYEKIIGRKHHNN
ncbi:hypothetical protein AGMMS49944_13440 [Spirochaetia bacterium]|nr:hypothetical protein AGMMS49944_13440 [Spirochaetia bacterium]